MDTELVQFGIEYRLCRKKKKDHFFLEVLQYVEILDTYSFISVTFLLSRTVMNDEFFIPFWLSTLCYRDLRERD